MGSVHQNLKAQGLAVLFILSADANDAAPTPEYCMQYAEQARVDPALMLIDHNFDNLFRAMDPGGTEIGLPWEGILNGRGMIYHWNSSMGGQGEPIVKNLLQ